jgi:hypothetical protein
VVRHHENDLIPSGRVDFDLYYRLLAAGNARASGQIASAAGPAVASPAAGSSGPLGLPKLALGTSRGARPTYRVDETMELQVQSSADAFVYCYYQDASGAVARIFPNRFQPDAFIPARRLVEIPPGGTPFNIRFDTPGTRETVACLASDLEVGVKLPEALKVEDLVPMPVRSIDEVADQFRRIAPSHVDDARLRIEVAR